jgi:hypothetical protein
MGFVAAYRRGTDRAPTFAMASWCGRCADRAIGAISGDITPPRSTTPSPEKLVERGGWQFNRNHARYRNGTWRVRDDGVVLERGGQTRHPRACHPQSVYKGEEEGCVDVVDAHLIPAVDGGVRAAVTVAAG